MMDTRFQLTLSVLLAVIREDNGQKLTVSLLPKFPDVFVGDDITLICKGGAGMIKWLINGVQQSHQDSLMLLTAVTSNNSGEYECEQGGTKSDKLILTVLELEPHAQLSPSIGGAVMSKGDGRNLVLQVDDDLNGWKCYVLRGENGFRIIPAVDEKKAVIFAELREAKRATFWCKKGTQRSNAVTLKMTVSADAARQEGDSDVQELKVIGGPPTATVDLASTTSLRCSCNACPAVCTSYRWYHTHIDDSSARQSLSESGQHIDMKEDGLYSCRMDCGKGFSRFSNVYHYKGQPTTESVSVLPIMVAPILIVLGVLIVVLVALKCRRRGESSVQTTKQDKDKKTGGDNEQIQLTDQAVYHTLGESTDKDKGEGGYEALQKRQEEMEYHTLGPGEGQSQGEGQGGYEALKNVKAEVYQTLSSAESKTPAAKAEGGYEQLPQKAKDYEAVTVEVNPYKALKAGQQDKKQATSKNKE